MGSWDHICNDDYRNDSWGFAGSGVAKCSDAWNNTDDTKYCYNPPHKGRASVVFPIDPSNLPTGAIITSVTIKIRGRKMVSNPTSATVNVMAKDNTSRYFSRSIYFNDTISDYTVGTYTKDPTGLAWDIERVNKLIAQVWVSGTTTHTIRIYRVWFTVTYKERPVVSITAPSGNQGTPSPDVSWTYTHIDGDLQKYADYKVFTKSTSQAISFNPDKSKSVISGRINGDIRFFTLPKALATGDYVMYVKAASETGAISAWASKSFTILAPIPGVPVLTPVGNSATSSVDLSILDTSNLLSPSQANAEVSADAFEYETTNCTLTRDTSTSLSTVGAASFKLAASSAATMSLLSSYIDVAESAPITVSASYKAGTTGRTVNTIATFYDQSYSSLGTITATGTDSTTWTGFSNTGTTPVGTRYAKVTLQVVSPASGEIHNVDSIGLMYGTNSPWTDGGHLSYNILDSNYSTSPAEASWTASGTTITSITPSGTGARGPTAMRLTPAPTASSISFIATGTTFSSTTSATDVTLNKPAGSTTGDLMIAVVTANNVGTITPPAGWLLVNTATLDNFTTQWVMYRICDAADPATWTANLFYFASRRLCKVYTYRGVDTINPFIDEGTSTQEDNLPTTLKTAVLNNTNANAWRVAAFSMSDDFSSATATANALDTSATGGISYVGAGTPWSTTNITSTSFTLNKPSGLAVGDLMIAFVAVSTSTAGVNTPSGWTLVRSTLASSSFATRLAVFKRTVDGTEGSTWSGTITSASGPKATQIVAYRGADAASAQFITDNSSTFNSEHDYINAPTLTNTDSRSWRITAFAANNDDITSWTSNEAIERADINACLDRGSSSPDPDYSVTMAIYDSNGPVPAGTDSSTITGYIQDYSGTPPFKSAVAWKGYIKVSTAGGPGAPPNESKRFDGSVGSSTPWMYQTMFDSGTNTVGLGAQSITATWTLGGGGGSGFTNAVSWAALLNPTSATNIEVRAKMTNYVDISKVNSDVLSFCNNKLTFTGHFKGTFPGTPFFKLYFYRANVLLSTSVDSGNSSFTTTEWNRSSATFDIPSGTTRIYGELYSPGVASISDTVDVDSLGICFGEFNDYWRGSSARSSHPVWSVPVIEYADDHGTGETVWKALPGIFPRPPAYDPRTGICTYTDLYPVPLVDRIYRVYTKAYGLNGDTFKSDYSISSPINVVAANWWIKDVYDPNNNMILPVKAESFSVTKTNTANVFQPLGEDYPIVLTEGYKSDTIDITLILQKDDWEKFRYLLKLGRSMFLQSDQDDVWWVRPVDDVNAETMVTLTRRSDPYRIISQKFIEVEPEI